MSQRPPEQHSLASRGIAAVMALASLVGGLGIAAHHPLSADTALVLVLTWSLACAALPRLWLLIVPALLPLIDLAPWSGWLTFEEFDLLLLGAAAGAYARLVVQARQPTASANWRTPRLALRSKLLLNALLISALVALYRGVLDAGGLQLGWFQGYDEALNSLRLLKSLLFALLLSPLLRWELARDGRGVARWLGGGLILGLAGAGLAAVWERAAFPGLLDFSSDYRTTALFWEMHVGGAALDGFLALTLPFALDAVLRTRSKLRWLWLAAVLLLSIYVCLTTFSRGVYLAVGTALVVLVLCQLRNRNAPQARPPVRRLLFGGILLALTVLAMQLVFKSGGYRAMLAVLAVVLLSLPLGSSTKAGKPGDWMAGGLAGLLLGLLGGFAAGLVSKGPYLLFALALGAALLAQTMYKLRSTRLWQVASIATYGWTVVQAAMVAWHWGGDGALLDTSLTLIGLLLVLFWQLKTSSPLWPSQLQGQGAVFGVIMLISGTIAVLSGGGYMAGRFSTSERDMGGRLQHWSSGLSLLHSDGDWLLGKGLGRFPANYLYGASDNEFPGSYRINNEHGNAYLTLAGPRHILGFGELFRMAQRVPVQHGGAYTAKLDVRVKEETTLHVEVCEKQLLYNAGCALQSLALKPDPGSWRTLTLRLDATNLGGGPSYAPRLAFFSIAVDTRGRVMDIDNVQLLDAQGRSLLGNGDFAREMAHWFFTSDRQHLPWHIKNLFLNVLFDQGLIGLALFLCLLVAAGWRLLVGDARSHPLAPALAASLLAFLVVGAFDSLLDVPRVAFLFYLLLMLALYLPAPRPGRPSAPVATGGAR
ncbi:hypothetical protein [Chitinimonas sp.]|uniref:hypothetical protein n=1 Tax=Chitinimonas sp. TaxID=1934313 RepID=UPI002F95AF9B